MANARGMSARFNVGVLALLLNVKLIGALEVNVVVTPSAAGVPLAGVAL